MKTNKTLLVNYHDKNVGTLALTKDGKVAFSYSAKWLEDGFSISPFSLPMKNHVFISEKPYFNGLFGVFADSLPDAWGQLLVRKLLKKNGIMEDEITVLDRLAIVGNSGMGALTYEPTISLNREAMDIDLDRLASACKALLLANDSEDIDTLYHLGGSSGGARPKITVKYGDKYWLIKFPAHIDSPDAGLMEYEYSQCALKCGIHVPETKLFSSKEGPGYFGCQRFDRFGDDRKHMLTSAAILEADYQSPCLDYHTLMKLTRILTRNNIKQLEEMYRRMCFNVYAHNRDDHAKNFTYIYDEAQDCYEVSPAYDLTYSTTYWGEHTTSINGNGRNPSKQDIIAVGKKAGLSESTCRRLDEEVHTIVHQYLRKWLK